MIINILSAFDLFMVPIVYDVDGKSKRSSFLGIFCSLIILIFLLYQFSTSEFFVKKSPNVLIQSLNQTHASRIDFNHNEPLIIALADLNNISHKIYDSSIFAIIVMNIFEDQFTYLETKRCTLEIYPSTNLFLIQWI